MSEDTRLEKIEHELWHLVENIKDLEIKINLLIEILTKKP